jgi:hypothetical protein
LLGTDTAGVTLPLVLTAQPNWLVPTNTNSFIVAAQATVPIVMDISAANGDPDRLGTPLPGNANVAALMAPRWRPASSSPYLRQWGRSRRMVWPTRRSA